MVAGPPLCGALDITTAEVAVLRLFTMGLGAVWNWALCNCDAEGKPELPTERNSNLKMWATSISLLCNAILKLSTCSDSEKILVLYHGEAEDKKMLPDSLFAPALQNKGIPGAPWSSFITATSDLWEAYGYAGG